MEPDFTDDQFGYGSVQIKGYTLVRTWWACPEQYDVFLNGAQVGYLRLRHGCFTADFPDVGGETVYEGCPDGDGIFNDYEREKYLTGAIDAIHARCQPTPERAP